MGLGGTAKKLQKVANAAEELYAKMNEVIGQLNKLRDEVEETSKQVDTMEYEMAEQRAILEGVAEELDVDVEAVLSAADLPEAPEAGDATEDAGGADGDTGGESTADSGETASEGGQGDTGDQESAQP